MVLPVIICMLKPSHPICKPETTTVLPFDQDDLDDDFTQDELLQYGGIGLFIFVLIGLLCWALNKAFTLRRKAQNQIREQQAHELKEIRRCLDDGGRKVL